MRAAVFALLLVATACQRDSPADVIDARVLTLTQVARLNLDFAFPEAQVEAMLSPLGLAKSERARILEQLREKFPAQVLVGKGAAFLAQGAPSEHLDACLAFYGSEVGQRWVAGAAPGSVPDDVRADVDRVWTPRELELAWRSASRGVEALTRGLHRTLPAVVARELLPALEKAQLGTDAQADYERILRTELGQSLRELTGPQRSEVVAFLLSDAGRWFSRRVGEVSVEVAQAPTERLGELMGQIVIEGAR